METKPLSNPIIELPTDTLVGSGDNGDPPTNPKCTTQSSDQRTVESSVSGQ